MAAHLDETALVARPTEELSRLRSRAIAIGGVGLALALLGWFLAPDVFWQSYLIGYVFWTGITVGSLAVLMLQHLTGGAWGLVARRVLEASTKTLPLMAVLFLPIAFNLTDLYAWARPEAAEDHLIHAKAVYLNVPFFFVRAVLFFVVWGGLIYFLNRWSREQDEQPPALPGPADRRFRLLSGPGLVIYMITVTFMSVDWIMSLDPHWYSTIFGILTVGGQGLSTLAFTIVVLAALARVPPMAGVASPAVFHDLSKLMLAFVLLWAYFAVSQLIIIWSGNLPEEVPFYLERLHGPWQPVSVAILLLHFALPFLLLLSRDLKRNPEAVKWVALLLLVMRAVDTVWMIAPVFRHEGSSLHWLDFAMVLGIGCLWLALFWRNLAVRPLVPARDPYLKEALANVGH